ncbi:MAG: hypothetical protein MSC31_11160 [Solirubrobacteraceae bacterium MAG38_C4-C5]|nr:hypothetical protein [Candidatus Siliceabacter maunaloa]
MAACSDTEEEGLRAEEIERAEADARREERAAQRSEEAITEAEALREELDELRGGGQEETARPPAPSPATAPSPANGGGGSSSCGDGLSVNSQTSCPFARVVRDAYEASGRSSRVQATSPVTGETYTMTCTSSASTVCTGGNNAAVYIRY